MCCCETRICENNIFIEIWETCVRKNLQPAVLKGTLLDNINQTAWQNLVLFGKRPQKRGWTRRVGENLTKKFSGGYPFGNSASIQKVKISCRKATILPDAAREIHWKRHRSSEEDNGGLGRNEKFSIIYFSVTKPFLCKWLWFALNWNCVQNSFSYERFCT